jgi:hypothetical protein
VTNRVDLLAIATRASSVALRTRALAYDRCNRCVSRPSRRARGGVNFVNFTTVTLNLFQGPC